MDDISAAVVAAFPKLSEVEQRVSVAIYRLLSKARPVTVDQITSASGIPPEAVDAMLSGWHGVDRDVDGAVIGFWGLSLSRTTHRLRVRGNDLHTWCAWDTLFLPALLGDLAAVESTCPATGKQISLRVEPSRLTAALPSSVALSFVIPREADLRKSIVETFCCHVRFFVSSVAASAWVAERPGTFVVTLEEAWQIGCARNAAQFADLARELNLPAMQRTSPARVQE